MYTTNGTNHNNNQPPFPHGRQRLADNRLPDEAWQVGDSPLIASVWIAQGRNAGEQFLDIRRVSPEGRPLKTFRTQDLRHFYQGLGEHAARLSQDESLTDDERDAFAYLATGTVELLENTPRVNPTAGPRRSRYQQS